jgi:PadR family transcriptional regulator PadR
VRRVRDALKGHVDLLLLSVLEDRPAHGYGLVESLRERSAGAFDLPEGTVYPSLYRLERRGLVASRWETIGGRRRRVYRLTRNGLEELARRRAEWRTFASAVEAVVA